MGDGMKLVAVSLLVIAGFLAFVFGGVRLVVQIDAPGQIAEIEQLRRDVQKVDVLSNEDVLGQVTLANQKIASTKLYAGLWWSGWWIPDAWENVDLIEIPGKESGACK